MIGHVNINSIPLVSCHDNHVTFTVSEEVVQDVAFYVRIVPNLCTLSSLVDLSDVLVNIR